MTGEPSKFRDLGERFGEIESPAPTDKHYPIVYLRLDALPELNGAELGSSVEILFRAEVKSVSINENRSEISLELKKASISSLEEKKEELEETIKKVIESKTEADTALSKLVGTMGGI